MVTHWTEAWPGIAERFAAAPRFLVACDFDGTLAPLHPDPDKVGLPAAALACLRRLRGVRGVSLAIISGRSLADVASRIPLDDIIVAGNHGLEIRGLGLDGERSQATILKPRLRALTRGIEESVGKVKGILIEFKGVSLSVHYRHVRETDREMVFHEVRRISLQDPQFKIQQGHQVMELLPDIGWNKGAALKQIAGRLGLPGSAVFYAGDDTTDETVFEAFPTALTFGVGLNRPTAARWMVRDPAEVCALLEALSKSRVL